jgi:hypothetical protein
MTSMTYTRGVLVERVLGSSWIETLAAHAPGFWRRLVAQAPYWQAVDAIDVTWLRLADTLGVESVGDLGSWLDHTAQHALADVRDAPWRTPAVPLGILGDTPPDGVLADARNAIRLRLDDATIAKPGTHPGLRPSADRGMDIPWRADGDVVVSPAAAWERTFDADGILIDLVLFSERERRLVGMVRGADLAKARLRTQTGEQVCSSESPGLFRAPDVPEGPLSVALDLTVAAGDRRIVTEWRAL